MNGFLKNLADFLRQTFAGIKQIKSTRLSHLRKVFSLMGKKEKIALWTLLGVAALSLFVSLRGFYLNHTVTVPASGGIYTEGLLGQPEYINPVLGRSETDLSIINLVFSGLYKYGPNGQLIPDLADSQPIISDDQKQYTINLKKNAQWHNGQPVTADDIVYTLQILKDPAYKSPLRNLWLSTNIEKLSDYSVKFTTKDVSGPFLQNLTLPILPKNIWSRVDAGSFQLSKLNLEAIGSGPYSIKEIKKQSSGKVQQISLEAFSNFYGAKPLLTNITFKFYDTEEDMLNSLHSGEIGGMGYMPLGSNLYLDKTQNSLQILTLPLPQYQVVFFNLNNKFLSDQNVRKALSLATGRQQIIDQVFNGNALLPSSPLLFGKKAPSEPGQANLAQAASLLDQAGWKVDSKTGQRANKKGTALQLTIATNDSLPNSRAAEILANQWKALNIAVNLTVLPTQQLTDTLIRPRSFDVLLFPQKFGADPDPFLFWHSSQIKDPGFNLTGFSDQTADKLITQARTTTNAQLRADIYQQFSQLLSDKVPVIFLDQTVFIYALDKNIKNINLQTLYEANERFYDTPNWYMETGRIWK